MAYHDVSGKLPVITTVYSFQLLGSWTSGPWPGFDRSHIQRQRAKRGPRAYRITPFSGRISYEPRLGGTLGPWGYPHFRKPIDGMASPNCDGFLRWFQALSQCLDPKAPTPKKRMPQMSTSSPSNAWKHRPGPFQTMGLPAS